jgi:DNA-binding SARP family transcriptional activator
MFWQERTQAQAMSNLRVALSSLRKHLDPYVVITRNAVALNLEADVRLDAVLLEQRLSCGRTEEALALYQGDFLEGFYPHGARGFEDWVLLQRERLRRLVLEALDDLVVQCIEQGDCKAGVRHAARLLELDPLREEGHRQMMRLLALSGQRGAALEQYQICRSVLADELGVDPAPETDALFEQIQAGELESPAPASAPVPQPHVRPQPAVFLEKERVAADRPVFVTRERELARLERLLNTALTGKGQVVFVTGGPGRGKTALMNEFARRAMDAHSNLLVASGNCNAYAGGDPCLPFREVMATLTGDIASQWRAGTITRDHARRLWDAHAAFEDMGIPRYAAIAHERVAALGAEP